MNIKYTPQQEDELRDSYIAIGMAEVDDAQKHDAREDFILKYMNKHNKSNRSVIAKLSKMDIYVARPKVSKVLNAEPETKKSMVESIAVTLGVTPDQFEGLDKAPKLVLKLLREVLLAKQA